jgi:hypothetical protein
MNNRFFREFSLKNNATKPSFIFKIYFIALFSLILSYPMKGHTLAIGPLNLKKPFGRLRIVNDAKRFRKINLITYPAILTDNNDYTIKVTGFDEKEIKNSVKYTPGIARVSAKGSRYVNYSILKEGAYYLCAESVISPRFKFRVCSLYVSER